MNGPELPVISAGPPEPPPSYLSRSHRPNPLGQENGPLVFVTGIAAIVIILWYATSYVGAVSGRLVIWNSDPAPGVYLYDFGTKSVTSLSALSEDTILNASLSPTGSHIAVTTVEDDIPEIMIRALGSASEARVRTGKKGEHLSLPVWSPDGAKISYAIISPQGPSSAPSDMHVAALDGSQLTSFSMRGVPIGFSPGGDYLLVRNSNALWIVDMSGKKQSQQPFVIPSPTMIVALSPDSSKIAYLSPVDATISTFNWSERTLTKSVEIPGRFSAAIFSETGDMLLLRTGEMVKAYALTEGGVVEKAGGQMPLQGSVRLLHWKP